MPAVPASSKNLSLVFPKETASVLLDNRNTFSLVLALVEKAFAPEPLRATPKNQSKLGALVPLAVTKLIPSVPFAVAVPVPFEITDNPAKTDVLTFPFSLSPEPKLDVEISPFTTFPVTVLLSADRVATN